MYHLCNCFVSIGMRDLHKVHSSFCANHGGPCVMAHPGSVQRPLCAPSNLVSVPKQHSAGRIAIGTSVQAHQLSAHRISAALPLRTALHGSLLNTAKQKPRERRSRTFCTVASFAPALVQQSSAWRVWTALTIAGALGFWSERTQIGKELSGPLVATLVGLALSNFGAIPCNAVQYGAVNKFLLPLAVPLLLFTADIRRVFKETGKLLVVFVCGSFATVAGTLAAAKLFPLTALGADGWKVRDAIIQKDEVASALCARHIGGAVNYVAVAESTGMSSSAQAAGLAADNLICAIYFTSVYALARNIPADAAVTQIDGSAAAGTTDKQGIQVLEGATAVALSAAICYLGILAEGYLQLPGVLIPCATAITVVLATSAPSLLAPLVSSAEGIAAILMNVFFATVGANGSVADVIRTAPALFVFCLLQIGVHLSILLSLGKMFGFTRRDVLLASNANVGGPTTAAGMAAAKGWRSSLTPAILVGTFGYAIATFVSVALGYSMLTRMM